MYRTEILKNRYKSLSTELADHTKKWIEVGTVERLYIYPIFAGKAMNLSFCQLDLCGSNVVKNDCQIQDNMFIIYNRKTQRVYQEKQDPVMHTVELMPVNQRTVLLTAEKMHKVLILDLLKIQQCSKIVPYFELFSHKYMIELRCLDCGEEAANWVTKCLDKPDLRLGFNKPGSMMTELFWNQFGQLHSLNNCDQESMICYAELPKYSLISKESYNIINKKMSHVIHMRHFIPNIVIVPIKNPSFFEIEWEWIKIGDTIIKNINPWGRYSDIEPKDLPIELIMQLMALTCSVYIPGNMQIGNMVYTRVRDDDN